MPLPLPSSLQPLPLPMPMPLPSSLQPLPKSLSLFMSHLN
jgi:hypothetical protein